VEVGSREAASDEGAGAKIPVLMEVADETVILADSLIEAEPETETEAEAEAEGRAQALFLATGDANAGAARARTGRTDRNVDANIVIYMCM
jgi:hypothetical protein